MIEWLTDKTFWVSMAPSIVVITVAIGALYLFLHPDRILTVLRSPTLIQDIGLTIVTTAFLLLIYVFVLRPQVRINTFTRIEQTCPDRWAFNESTGECEPRYRTSCTPFRPQTLKSFRDQCDFASACGTTWAGFCT